MRKKHFTIADKSFVIQTHGDYHYLNRSESGQFVVRNTKTGTDFSIAHATNDDESEWYAIFASIDENGFFEDLIC
jgi:hypothetical protein